MLWIACINDVIGSAVGQIAVSVGKTEHEERAKDVVNPLSGKLNFSCQEREDRVGRTEQKGPKADVKKTTLLWRNATSKRLTRNIRRHEQVVRMSTIANASPAAHVGDQVKGSFHHRTSRKSVTRFYSRHDLGARSDHKIFTPL